MKRLFILTLILTFIYTLLSLPSFAEPRRGRFTRSVQGYSTAIQVYVPNSYSEKTKIGLILGLHGSGGNGGEFMSKWNTGLLEKYGFIMVAPDSLTRTWAMGGDLEGQQKEGDYIKTIVAEMRKEYNIDEEKIYVTGFSAGSAYLMVGIAALQQFRTFKIRGAALFSGGITGEMGVNADKAKETSIRIYCGTGDTPHLGPAQNAADSFKKAGYNCEFIKVPGGHNYPLTDHTKVIEWFVELYEPVRKMRDIEKDLQEGDEQLKEKKYADALKFYDSAKKKAEKDKDKYAELLKKAEEGVQAVEKIGAEQLAEAQKLADEDKFEDAYKILKQLQKDYKNSDIGKQAKEKYDELKAKEKEKK